MRKLFYTVILIFAIYFIATHIEELELILAVLGRGDWRWLLAAVGVQILWLVNISAAFQSTYRLVGVRERLIRMLPLMTAANFVNVVAPSYGLGALAVLIGDGQQRGKPAAKVTTAVILYLVYDYLGFMVVLVIGTLILAYYQVMDIVLIGASLFAVGIAVVLVTLTLLGIQSAEKLGDAILWLRKTVNRLARPLIHRELISLERVQVFASDFAEGLQHIRRSPSRLLLPGVLALTRKALMMTILYLVSVAYRNPFNLDVLTAAFSTSYLFTIASITPSGVGFVEGAMTIYLKQLAVPLETSAAISVAYRGITFWLTLLYGMIAIRIIDYSNGRFKRKQMTPEKVISPSQAHTSSVTPKLGSANPIHSQNNSEESSEP
jgi:uncharacterized protein (TIRG00374 family)